jgi:hypothetical protein
LVGFGYPWAVVAPILITLGIPDLDALRVAAIANNAPVSYGALGAPIIALSAVTGLPLLALSGSIGHIVAILALLPPWILIYLVAGKAGLRDGWPLAIVGSLGYIAGQFPVAVYLGPYLPDIAGAIVSFVLLLLLLKIWRPATVLGYGGVPVPAAELARGNAAAHGLTGREVLQAWMPFAVLVIVVVLWTGPWSPLPRISLFQAKVVALSSVSQGKQVAALFNFTPFVGGSAILASWVIVALLLRLSAAQLGEIWRTTWRQMWGALLVGVFIFGLAYVYNYAGYGSILGLWLCQDRLGFYHRGSGPRLDRCGVVGQQHLDKRDVWRNPDAGRQAARLSGAASTDAQLGRCRNRQAGGAADGERRRRDDALRAQRRGRHPPQYGLDILSAGLPRSDRDRLLFVLSRCCDAAGRVGPTVSSARTRIGVL